MNSGFSLLATSTQLTPKGWKRGGEVKKGKYLPLFFTIEINLRIKHQRKSIGNLFTKFISFIIGHHGVYAGGEGAVDNDARLATPETGDTGVDSTAWFKDAERPSRPACSSFRRLPRLKDPFSVRVARPNASTASYW